MDARELYDYLRELHNNSTACGWNWPGLEKINVNFRRNYDSDIEEISFVTEDLYNPDDNSTLESIVLVWEHDIDLFEKIDELPKNVQEIIIKHDNNWDAMTLEEMKNFEKDLLNVGYQFDYWLDMLPHSLKKQD